MGHINSAVGFGDLLKAHGHRVIFAKSEKFWKLAADYGFEFRPIGDTIVGQDGESLFMKRIVDNSKYSGSN